MKQGGQEHAKVEVQRLRVPSVHRASKKDQGQAFEGSVTRCVRIRKVNRQSREGEKTNCEYESIRCTSPRTGALPFSVLAMILNNVHLSHVGRVNSGIVLKQQRWAVETQTHTAQNNRFKARLWPGD